MQKCKEGHNFNQIGIFSKQMDFIHLHLFDVVVVLLCNHKNCGNGAWGLSFR